MAANPVTGTPSSSNYLRGDGTWATVTASPAGSTTQIQYNNAGALAGSANMTFDGTTITSSFSGAHNGTVGATTPSTVVATQLTVNGANLNTAISPTGTGTVTISPAGALTINPTAASTINNASIGATTASTGRFTTVSLTGTTDQVSSVAVSSDPSAPSAGNLKTFAKSAASYTAPAFLNSTNASVLLQPSWANKHIGINFVSPSSSSYQNIGMRAIAGNALTNGVVSTTNMFSRTFRITSSSTATAGTLGYFNTPATEYTLGSATTPAYGGFYLTMKFGIADTVANPRTFVGISSSTGAPTNVEPSTLVNSIGVGQGAANTNLFVYYGGSAAQTPIDLGINFPTNTSSTDWYELTLFAPPTSNNTVYYQVTRLNTGNVASGTLTGTAGTALPSNTTTLCIRAFRSNNATASAVTLALGNCYIETDY
jgi:hypothetical protein